MFALTQRTRTIYTFIHQIYANHNLVAQAAGFVPMMVLFQQPRIFLFFSSRILFFC